MLGENEMKPNGRLQQNVRLSEWLGFSESFPLQNSSYIFECCADSSWREGNVCKSVNIRELLAAIFEKDYGAANPEVPLEQSYFMDYVGSCMARLISVFILRGHDQECKCGDVEHVLNSFSGRNSRY